MIPEPRYTCSTLSNGMAAVHIAASAASEMCGVFIDAGTRDEPTALPGLAHFVEHTIFKGTRRRSSWHINNRMESIGGELNAFTAKEETFVYAIGPAGCLSRASELVADLITEASFPEHEIDIERSVICDEIDSYRDTPSEAVFDDFEDALFAGSNLGHNILGTRQSVDIITAADCRQFIEQYYTPGRMVFFYVGRRGPAAAFRTAEKYFGNINRPNAEHLHCQPAPVEKFNITDTDNRHQANTILGLRIPGRHNPRRHAIALLANITGGPGMNSLLNLELRERRGLVYSVDTSATFYTDCGMLAIAYGCDPDDDARCAELTASALRHKLPQLLTGRRLEAAKRQYMGQLTVSYDNRDAVAFRACRALMYYGHTAAPSSIMATIEALTTDDMMEAAQLYFNPDNFSKLTLV